MMKKRARRARMEAFVFYTVDGTAVGVHRTGKIIAINGNSVEDRDLKLDGIQVHFGPRKGLLTWEDFTTHHAWRGYEEILQLDGEAIATLVSEGLGGEYPSYIHHVKGVSVQ